MWRGLCAVAGVRPLTLHGARHSSVTMMRAHGIADAVVSAFHGHDETVMRRTYTHVTMDELRAAADQNVTSQAGK
jgi:integrase